jgi:hypothetical protein
MIEEILNQYTFWPQDSVGFTQLPSKTLQVGRTEAADDTIVGLIPKGQIADGSVRGIAISNPLDLLSRHSQHIVRQVDPDVVNRINVTWVKSKCPHQDVCVSQPASNIQSYAPSEQKSAMLFSNRISDSIHFIVEIPRILGIKVFPALPQAIPAMSFFC